MFWPGKTGSLHSGTLPTPGDLMKIRSSRDTVNWDPDSACPAIVKLVDPRKCACHVRQLTFGWLRALWCVNGGENGKNSGLGPCLGRGSKIKQMRAENVIFMLKKAKNLREIYHLPPCLMIGRLLDLLWRWERKFAEICQLEIKLVGRHSFWP